MPRKRQIDFRPDPITPPVTDNSDGLDARLEASLPAAITDALDWQRRQDDEHAGNLDILRGKPDAQADEIDGSTHVAPHLKPDLRNADQRIGYKCALVAMQAEALAMVKDDVQCAARLNKIIRRLWTK